MLKYYLIVYNYLEPNEKRFCALTPSFSIFIA